VVGSRIVQELASVAPEAAPERARTVMAEFREALGGKVAAVTLGSGT